jgi:hypothetical protein
MLKNLAILGAFYFGARSENKYLRYGVIAGLGIVIIRGYSQGGSGVAGMGIKIDPELAVDMLFPDMTPERKAYTKLAASELMKGLFPAHRGIQVGRI